MTKCMIDKLRGCDQETIESILEEDTTFEEVEAGYQLTCLDEPESDCNFAGVRRCMPTEGSGDTSAPDPCR